MSGPWFRRSRDGLRWTPVTWQGWLVTALSLVLVLAANIAVVMYLTRHP